jgi:hypothetical protein
MPKVPKITATFALVEIKLNRKAVAKLVESGYEIPFTLTGTITAGKGGVGNDDGVGIAFVSDIKALALGEPKFIPGDIQGRPWALRSEVKAGDVLECDGGFTCMGNHAKKRVKLGTDDLPYIDCDDGRHYLAGQVGKHGELIGLYKSR